VRRAGRVHQGVGKLNHKACPELVEGDTKDTKEKSRTILNRQDAKKNNTRIEPPSTPRESRIGINRQACQERQY